MKPYEIAYDVADVININALLNSTHREMLEAIADYFEILHNGDLAHHEVCERLWSGTCIQAQPFDRTEFIRRATGGTDA